MKTKLALLAGALMLSVSSLTSYAEDGGSNVMFIFDSSGSMKKSVESGESRSDAAKRAMASALNEIPEGTNLGLLMYGHRKAKDCSDIEIIAPIGTTDSKGISDSILASQPKGETPIAAALESAAGSFTPMAGQSNSIVLVTDGIEECGGDPCAAARAIRDAGLGIKAHVVGFTLDEKQRQTIQCIADETGGKYFDAQNSDGLSSALAEVQKAVVQVPAEPVRERVFFDDFDGADLAEHWLVNNPNPDGYIVENGNLLMVNGAVGGFDKTDSANLIQLERDLPEGDWDAHVTFSGEFKSLRDQLGIALRADEKNFLSANLFSSTYNTGSSSTGDNRKLMNLRLLKLSNGTETVADKVLSEPQGFSTAKPEGFSVKGKLTLSKRGRSYVASFRPDGEVGEDGKPIIHETQALTSLRSPGKFMFTTSKYDEAVGEVEVKIESVEIETVKAAP
jgi:Ca-activated chloride channel family protein